MTRHSPISTTNNAIRSFREDREILRARVAKLEAALTRLVSTCDSVPWPGPYRADLVDALNTARSALKEG